MIFQGRMCSNCLLTLCLASWTLCLVLYGVSGYPAARLDNSLVRRLRRAEGLPPLPVRSTLDPLNSDTGRRDSSLDGGETDKIAGVGNEAESMNTVAPGDHEARDQGSLVTQPVKDITEPKISEGLPGEGTKQDLRSELEQVKTTPGTSFTSEPTRAKAESDSLNAPPLDINVAGKTTTTESSPEHPVTPEADGVPIKDPSSDTGAKSSLNTTTQLKTPEASSSPLKLSENEVTSTSTPEPVLVPDQNTAPSGPETVVILSSSGAPVVLDKPSNSEPGSTTIKYPTSDTIITNDTRHGSKVEPDYSTNTTTDSTTIMTMLTMAPPPPPLQPPAPMFTLNETTGDPILAPLILLDGETTLATTTETVDKTMANESLIKSSPDKSYLPLGTNATLSNYTTETVVMETPTPPVTELIVTSDVTDDPGVQNVTLEVKSQEISVHNETNKNVTTPDTLDVILVANTTSEFTTQNTTDEVSNGTLYMGMDNVTVTSSQNVTDDLNDTTPLNKSFSSQPPEFTTLNKTDSNLYNATTQAENVTHTVENATQPFNESLVLVTDSINITSLLTTTNVTEVINVTEVTNATEVINATEVTVTPPMSSEVTTNQTASTSAVVMTTTTVVVNKTTSPLQEITVIIPTSTLPTENTSLNSSATVSQSEGLSASAMTAIITGSIIGFWIILGPIICLVCKLRDKRKERYHMSLTNQVDPPSDNGMLDAMIISELKKTAENKDNGTTGKEKQYSTVANDKAETERLRSGFEEHQF